MSIEAMKQYAIDLVVSLKGFSIPKDAERAYNKLCQAIAEAEKQVAFKIYKPTPPQGAIPNVRDAELPWVYDQDPSSGNVASMWVTPVKPHPQPKREWVGLTPTDMEELSSTWWKPNENEMALIDWVEAKLKQKNGYGITSDMKQEPVDKTAKQRHEENT